jgi:hypothetical protein
MKNTITVNYDTMILILIFNSVKHTFDLKNGDAGEFWYGFEHNGEPMDLNFHINDDGIASASVYGTEINDEGFVTTNTSDETYIENKDVTEIGDRDYYLTYWWYDDLAKKVVEVTLRDRILKAIMNRYGGFITLSACLDDDRDTVIVNLSDDLNDEATEDEIQDVINSGLDPYYKSK